jgi:hypothetical protein
LANYVIQLIEGMLFVEAMLERHIDALQGKSCCTDPVYRLTS